VKIRGALGTRGDPPAQLSAWHLGNHVATITRVNGAENELAALLPDTVVRTRGGFGMLRFAVVNGDAPVRVRIPRRPDVMPEAVAWLLAHWWCPSGTASSLVARFGEFLEEHSPPRS
jgi:hypothetical protein